MKHGEFRSKGITGRPERHAVDTRLVSGFEQGAIACMKCDAQATDRLHDKVVALGDDRR